MNQSDLIIISLAEYNGSYTAAFKNIFDWISKFLTENPLMIKIFLVATSPGGRGGMTVLEAAKAVFPFHGGNVVEDFVLPFWKIF